MRPRIARAARLTVLAGIATGLACSAWAQSPSGAIASGSVAAAVDGGDTHVSAAGSLGYRFNRAMGIGVELTWMSLKPSVPTISPLSSVPYTISFSNTKADAIFFTTNVRVEI